MFCARRALRLRTYQVHSYALVRTAVSTIYDQPVLVPNCGRLLYSQSKSRCCLCVRVCVGFSELQVVVVVVVVPSVDRWLTIDLSTGTFLCTRRMPRIHTRYDLGMKVYGMISIPDKSSHFTEVSSSCHRP